jgi:hypothetical protein
MREPSEHVRRQGWVSFDPGEQTTGPLGHLIGNDRMIWASDFPHSDARYPGVVAESVRPPLEARAVAEHALELGALGCDRWPPGLGSAVALQLEPARGFATVALAHVLTSSWSKRPARRSAAVCSVQATKSSSYAGAAAGSGAGSTRLTRTI